MTEQEAIKALEFDMEMILFDPYTGEKRTPEQVKAINKANYLCYLADDMAIKALEKQIAKKPHRISEIDDNDNAMVECPICHANSDYSVNTIKSGYCWKCGQKLDWE